MHRIINHCIRGKSIIRYSLPIFEKSWNRDRKRAVPYRSVSFFLQGCIEPWWQRWKRQQKEKMSGKVNRWLEADPWNIHAFVQEGFSIRRGERNMAKRGRALPLVEGRREKEGGRGKRNLCRTDGRNGFFGRG